MALAETINNCVALELVAFFVPRSRDDADCSAFLVLNTEVPSSTRVMSTQEGLNGNTSILVCRSHDYRTDYYDRYEDLADGRLGFHQLKTCPPSSCR